MELELSGEELEGLSSPQVALKEPPSRSKEISANLHQMNVSSDQPQKELKTHLLEKEETLLSHIPSGHSNRVVSLVAAAKDGGSF